uniref:Inactive hydroxysteroid dehydrogenase-like protein 1 n=1 Tax=Periophthalmus magnuspinnatus TaxID=409849 RepID=A0A3B4AW62_9GOBI
MAAVDSFSLLYREIARSCSFYYETLALVGVLYTASKAVALLRNCCSLVRVHFLPRIFTNKKLSHRFGDWAVIYGKDQSPVALAYAEELARQGVTYGVETVVILADFSKDQSALKLIQEVIRDKDIGFLVNCVEEALTQPQNLMEVNEESLMGAVNKNTTVMTLMTRLVLPGMLQRSRGAVVNITTGACCKPLPGRVMLTASMGYLDHFSRALYLEYSSKGIFIQSLTPFQIASTRRNLKEGLFVPKPQVYAQHAISTLGVSNRTTGYWPHTLQYGLIRCIPDWIWILGSRLFIS